MAEQKLLFREGIEACRQTNRPKSSTDHQDQKDDWEAHSKLDARNYHWIGRLQQVLLSQEKRENVDNANH